MQHKGLYTSGYCLDKSKLTDDEIEKIKDSLMVKPRVNLSYCLEQEPFPVHREDNGFLFVPRYWGTSQFGAPVVSSIDTEYKTIDIQFTKKLRPAQETIVATCLEKIKRDGGGLICLPCGMGKTALALYISTVLKVKTLVIVHKTFLQNQWIERAEQFTNASIGIIRQKKVNIDNKDIVIGMLQSISTRDYDPAIFKQFGCVIIDECHRAPSRIYSRAMGKIGCKYTIGLSATPNRKDGLTKVINWYVGPILVQLERNSTDTVFVKKFDYTSPNVMFKEKKRFFNGKSVPDMVSMITTLHKINDRNTFITDILEYLVRNSRKIIVFSERIDHLKKLKMLIDGKLKLLERDGEIDHDEITTGFYIGEMKEEEHRASAECDIIFATYHIAAEGLDIDDLNTLILATPKTDVIQTVGRILRKQECDNGGINPLVIDICDTIPTFQKWGAKRYSYYSKKKYTVDKYNCYNGECVSFDKFLRIKGVIEKDAVLTPEELRKRHIMSYCSEFDYEMKESSDFEDDPIENYKITGNISLQEVFRNVVVEKQDDAAVDRIELDLATSMIPIKRVTKKL